ncbi:MAG: Rieske 2Fe-2S domain-containing protein [Aquincola sp.]|nr:Rieske 2Fe-2S domain-containing protein [Aquincola sp.]
MPIAMQFNVDPDISRARTPDARFYLDHDVFAAVRERVFARSWQWIGALADVAAPGSLSPRLMTPGLLDEPLLLSRDAGGTLRCLPNVCTHRGHQLVDVPCHRGDIRCPYHSRRFDLAGRMTFTPGFDDTPDFPSDSDHLRALPFGEFDGHGFASLDPAIPLDDLLTPVRAHLPHLALDSYAHDPSRDRDFGFDAHWALYVENYLEGLHIPFLHAGLMQNLDWQQYRYELHLHGNLQLGLDGQGGIAAHYFWLFPNLMLNFYPWGLSVNQVLPLAPERTRVIFRSYVARPELLGQGAGAALDMVEMEDEAAVQSVQRGIRSRAWRGGRYSPQHERGVHQFHRMLAQALA